MLRKDDPTMVGGYRLERRLGAGGMGVVYLARSGTGRAVALKVIGRQWTQDTRFRARFQLEVAAARMVHSPFTAPVVDADPDAASPWMATEYSPGRSLTDRVGTGGPLSTGELEDLAAALAHALRDIHRAGVIHRDLKPGNVLLTADGPRVIDFGIARAMDGNPLTRTGETVGTPAFMAPEQLTSTTAVGPAADMFSLGCVLAFAATGRSPFQADSPFAAAYQVVHEEPDLEQVPSALRPLVADCLAKDPTERPTPEQALALATTPRTRPVIHPARCWRRRLLQSRGGGRTATVLPAALAAIVTGVVVAGFLTWPSVDRTRPGWPWETAVSPKPHGVVRCAAGDDALYCTTADPSVLRIDTTDGEIVWSRTLRSSQSNTYLRLLGVADGQLFYSHQRLSRTTSVSAVDTDTGETRWTKDTKHVTGVELTDSTLYIRGRKATTAIETKTKATRWIRRQQLDMLITGSDEQLHGITTTTPTHAFSDDNEAMERPRITAIDRTTGRTLWATTLPQRLWYTASSPTALYFTDTTGRIHRLDTRTRTVTTTVIPRSPGGGGGGPPYDSPAQGDLLYLTLSSSRLLALDTKARTVRWDTTTSTRIAAPATLADGYLYLRSREGSVIALDADTGRELWRTQPRETSGENLGASYGAPPPSPVMLVEGRLYAVSARGTVYAIDILHSPKHPTPTQHRTAPEITPSARAQRRSRPTRKR